VSAVLGISEPYAAYSTYPSPEGRFWPGSNARRMGEGYFCGYVAGAPWQGKNFATPIARAQKKRDCSMDVRCDHVSEQAFRDVVRPALQAKPKLRLLDVVEHLK
jgi:hypothetical protein